MTEFTKDTFLNGRLRVSQFLKGYRFSIDAALLAGVVRPRRNERILDLGTGCGIIPLILATRYPETQLLGVEVQPELAALARDNITDNHLERRIEIRQVDLKRLPDTITPGPFDWVVANPPYRLPDAGRMNPNEQSALARFEINVNLAQLVLAASRLLKTGGRFATIHTAERLVDLLFQMRQASIEPKWMQTVQSRDGEPAKLVLVRGVRGARPGLSIEAPLVVYGPDGTYTEPVQVLLRP